MGLLVRIFLSKMHNTENKRIIPSAPHVGLVVSVTITDMSHSVVWIFFHSYTHSFTHFFGHFLLSLAILMLSKVWVAFWRGESDTSLLLWAKTPHTLALTSSRYFDHDIKAGLLTSTRLAWWGGPCSGLSKEVDVVCKTSRSSEATEDSSGGSNGSCVHWLKGYSEKPQAHYDL